MKCASFTGVPMITKLAQPTTDPVTEGNRTAGGKILRDIWGCLKTGTNLDGLGKSLCIPNKNEI